MADFVDFYLDIYGGNDYYDIDIEDGDVKKIKGLDTSIIISVLSNQRASASEVPYSLNRNGWWGNLFLDYENGSKVWLLFQATATENNRNLLNDYVTKSLNWLKDDGFIESFSVDTTSSGNIFDFTVTIQGVSFANTREFNLLGETGV